MIDQKKVGAIPANLKAATLLFFSDNQGAPCAGWAPHSSCALYLRTITRDLMWRTGVTPRFSVAHRVFFLVAGQLRVTLLVRLTQCVQPMVGVTRYDLPVVDVILERPFTGYSGGRALVLQNHWGTLVGAPYWCQKQTERDRFAVDEMQVDWLSLRDYKQQNEWTTNQRTQKDLHIQFISLFVLDKSAFLVWSGNFPTCGCEIAVTSHWFPISLVW